MFFYIFMKINKANWNNVIFLLILSMNLFYKLELTALWLLSSSKQYSVRTYHSPCGQQYFLLDSVVSETYVICRISDTLKFN